MTRDPRSELATAFDNTVESGPVRFEYNVEPSSEGRGAQYVPAVLGALTRVAKIELPTMDGSMAATGVMEFSPPRFMMDFGHYAVLGRDGTEWKGRAGRDVASLESTPLAHGHPIWLVALAGGVVDATEDEKGAEVGGVNCRCYTAIVDLPRARHRIGADLVMPPGRTLDDFARVDASICVDDTYLRRVLFRSRFIALRLDLLEFHASPPSAWDRLPTFSTPTA